MKLWAILAALLVVSNSPGADWPQWRGLNRDGVSAEQVSAHWPADGPKVLWRAAVGTGFASFAIIDGRAYTLGNTQDQDTIWCLDALTGKEIWKHTYPSKLDPQFYEGGPGATPAVENGCVFTIGKWGQVFCLDASKGTIIWQRDLCKEGLRTNRWGFAGSPLVWHGLVIFNAGSAGTALDRKTGRVVWRNGTNAAGYASPVAYHSGGKDCILIFGARYAFALDPKSGREFWRHPWETGWDTNNADPLAYGDSVFISSFSRGCALLSLKQVPPKLVYDEKVLHLHLSPGILRGEYLYAFNGEALKDTDFRCIHLPTGELKWARKDPAFGSVICAGEKLIILSEKGELLMGDASPVEFKTVARTQVLGGKCWTPPALANGLLYARNAAGQVVCLDLSAIR